MAELVAKRYSNALFEVALEINTIDVFKEELMFISNCLKEYSQLDELLASPLIQLQEKKDLVTQIFKDGVSNEMLNFLYILLDKRRQGYLQDITTEYVALANASKNMVSAVAITASPMKMVDLQVLEAKLSKSSGKNVQLTNQVDGDIIGGILIKMGDKVIDGTIKNRLGQLKEQLSQIIV
ncbi:F0F1 ATP synthase subunit delta [Alkaliphilus serpentinus]|uniref:ATP synthase subunit delta n=1 Tax=Alkaliphilus serpentinus TaxID=1482731 RepID=A0A833HPN8_9FIRM|nr:F0F1 ATP synthase subunit delta [Alkaliphilus serpentinus]KAB3530895.1 F0F1 ATP synthase subunit delta [Alkaliphilus serpentinus]